MTKITKLTIDRGGWLSGREILNHLTSSLHEPRTGLKCCLGFYGLACGVPLKDLTDRFNFFKPGEGEERSPARATATEEMGWLFGFAFAGNTHTSIQYLLTTANDSISLTNDSIRLTRGKREAAIIRLFALGGVEVEFVGDAAEAVKKVNKVLGIP